MSGSLNTVKQKVERRFGATARVLQTQTHVIIVPNTSKGYRLLFTNINDALAYLDNIPDIPEPNKHA